MEIYGGREMIMPGKIVSRLDKMLTDAIDGSFIESDYDEQNFQGLKVNSADIWQKKSWHQKKYRKKEMLLKNL